MNYKIIVFLLAVVLWQVTESCQKDELPDGRFIGTWVSEDKADTLYFIDDTIFKTPRYDGVLHTYSYHYDEDSITVQYAGPNKVLLPAHTHHYTLTSSILILDKYTLNEAMEPIALVLHRENTADK